MLLYICIVVYVYMSTTCTCIPLNVEIWAEPRTLHRRSLTAEDGFERQAWTSFGGFGSASAQLSTRMVVDG